MLSMDLESSFVKAGTQLVEFSLSTTGFRDPTRSNMGLARFIGTPSLRVLHIDSSSLAHQIFIVQKSLHDERLQGLGITELHIPFPCADTRYLIDFLNQTPSLHIMELSNVQHHSPSDPLPNFDHLLPASLPNLTEVACTPPLLPHFFLPQGRRPVRTVRIHNSHNSQGTGRIMVDEEILYTVEEMVPSLEQIKASKVQELEMPYSPQVAQILPKYAGGLKALSLYSGEYPTEFAVTQLSTALDEPLKVTTFTYFVTDTNDFLPDIDLVEQHQQVMLLASTALPFATTIRLSPDVKWRRRAESDVRDLNMGPWRAVISDHYKVKCALIQMATGRINFDFSDYEGVLESLFRQDEMTDGLRQLFLPGSQVSSNPATDPYAT
ncbi:hypothetical protein JAAARDRAFT_48922 [Jaapia argillacea MUCL 33604]|uniref:Uncharacterized protein n=1 Tax=Jaapia argillacea MUCL 33604 TaxID=933084 RepID=A0A067PK33_9AGAM|nr:hypothetical protein JAAARDRAFT_48922 [Jaapia argillacea MUCL 33604]